VKDAQRHGLKCKPIDLTRSDWNCTLEKIPDGFAVRLGMRYVKGLRQEIALEIMRQRELRAFASVEDLKQRVPEIQKSELTALAEVGALNFISARPGFHRRDALWQVERAARRPGPLLETQEEASPDEPAAILDSPLSRMTDEERLVADFRGTGLTVGPHPMAYRRAELKQRGVRAAIELAKLPDGTRVRVAGAVIARQRPGTAKGFVFLSLEDETGIANAIITPQLFERDQTVVVNHPFLLIEGTLQNQENVVSVKVERVLPLDISRAEVTSHDFH
jgi:error-prone DNA polymerase